MRLEAEELQKLVELTNDAQTTPVIGFSMQQMMEGRDLASLAWNHVREYWKELGLKYGFTQEYVAGINKKTGEILFKILG